MSNASPVFELEGALRRRPRSPAIGPFSLAVTPGSLCALLGPSGSGKSTLLALLAGIEVVDSGRVRWSGVDVTHASQSALALARRGRIGIVGQGFALLEHLPLWQGVAIGCVVQGIGRAEQQRRAHAELERVGISAALAQRLPRELSGGERQRAAVARALISAQVGLIADEPTSNQDPANAQLVLLALSEAKARGCAVIVSTHDLQLERLADQRIALRVPGALS